jgi:hypothetical protein
MGLNISGLARNLPLCERGDWQPCASASGVKVVVFTLEGHAMFITNSLPRRRF